MGSVPGICDAICDNHVNRSIHDGSPSSHSDSCPSASLLSHTDYRTSREPPEARSRIPQTKLSHGRRYDCHATTRTKSRLSQFSLGQIAHSSVLPDLRLLSERLLFYCIFCFYPVNIALRIRREWNHGRFLLASNIHTHIHTLPSKRWVVRMCCIYFKMAEASRPGIGYTYRLIFSNFVYRPLDCGGVLGLGFGAGRWLLLGESKLRHWYRPLGNCEVGLARSFFRMTATAYLVSLLPRLGGFGSLWSPRLRRGWLVSGSLHESDKWADPRRKHHHIRHEPNRTEPNRTHTFLIHRNRRIRHAALCWKNTVVCTSLPLPPLLSLPLTKNLSYETNPHKIPGYRERGSLKIQTTLRP